MKNKKDKVTLKEGEVDKPEVFQHFTGGIDPYHIEPIDNPQKQEMGWTDIYGNPLKQAQEHRLIEDEAFALNLLKAIKKDHPEVLKQFLEEDGK